MSFISKILDAFKLESTREMSISESYAEIDRANKLADIANKTTDREEFYNAIEEIENILTELSKHEHKFDFSYLPSANLRDLRREKEKETVNVSASATNSNKQYKQNDYYKNIAKQKESNLQITYDDVECYDLRPFDLSKPFISDGHFTVIELEGENLEKAYRYLQIVHDILIPFNHLFENVVFPIKIGTDYMFGDSDGHLPVSHLRLSPYTATMKVSKYPLHLWLSYFGNYGTEYIYSIYLDKSGEIGKCDLSLHGSNGARISYESKIRRNESGLYVMQINKTLYIEPYGTKIVYHYQDEIQKQKELPSKKIETVSKIEAIGREKESVVHKAELKDANPYEDKTRQKTFKYVFPSISLLNKGQGSENCIREVEQRLEKLKRTFEVFGVKADIVDVSHGARFTRFEIQIGKGVRIRDVLRIEDDIKLNLEAANLHIEAPIPGRTTIGIDVENKKLSIVTFREVIESKEFREFPSNLAVAVGKDVVGHIIVESLDNMCHMLIGGTTGSGKSVCISSIIMSILYKSDPNEVKLILIDTKAINLCMYSGIPHLLIPVVTDLRKAARALQWAIAEMTDRYRKFADFGVRDLAGYNKAVEEYSSNDESHKKIPSIVIIIDDFSDLMIENNSSVEESVCRLAQMGRAAGIHLIISTQRPSVDVITGIIKANIPSRIAFNVFSAIDSRTILDAKGAEDLLSNGDMLFYPQGARTPLRIQGTYVSDTEIENVIDFVRNQMVGYYGADYEKKAAQTQSRV